MRVERTLHRHIYFWAIMAAHIAALCRGDLAVRDRARLYIDRVKVWELQGNARSTQAFTSGIIPACVWLACNALGATIMTKDDMMKASGLSPTEFDRALDVLKPVVSMAPARRQRRMSSQVPQTLTQKPLSKDDLMEKAKQVQTGSLFKQKEPEPQRIPAKSLKPNHSLTRLRESLVAEQNQAESAESSAASPPKPQPQTRPTRGRPPSGARSGRAASSSTPKQEEPPRQQQGESVQWMSAEDENAMWARILGKRIGIGRSEEPRRKRGRPPGTGTKKAAAPLVSSTPTLPPAPETRRPVRYPPPRYRTVCPLDEKELHMLRPLPIPLAMATCDPSMPCTNAERVWARWRATL